MIQWCILFFILLSLLVYLNIQSKENFISNSNIYKGCKSKLRKHHRNVTRRFNFHITDIGIKSKRLLRKCHI